MPPVMRLLALAVVLFTLSPTVRAQTPPDPTARSQPLRKPSQRDLDRREALHLYGLGIQYQHHNRLPDALEAIEKACRLDPDAAEPRRALIPLYLALDRPDDALAACREVVKLDPDDHDTWYLYARQLRSLDRPKEALVALEKAAACPSLKDRPELKVVVLFDLGVLHEQAKSLDEAQAAFARAAELLDKDQHWLDHAPFSKEEVAQQAAEIYERMGRLSLQAGRTERAVEAFKKAQVRDPGRSSRLAYNLAEVLTTQGKPAEALKHLDPYLDRQPPGTEGYELKIKLLKQLGRDNQIVAALQGYARNDPHNGKLKLLLAREYRHAGQPQQALREYNALVEKDPTPEAYRGLFDLLRGESGGADTILDRLDEAMRKSADEEDERRVPGPMASAAAAQARGMIGLLREDKQLVKLLLPAAYRRVIGSPPSSKPLASQTRLLLATLGLRAGLLDEAEALYRACLDGKGRVVKITGSRNAEQEVYGGLLRVLARAHKSREIVELCQQGLEHAEATNRVMFYLDMARAQMALDRVKESLEAIDAAVEHASERDQLVCRCVRADLLSRAEKHKEAVAECEALLKAHATPADVRSIRYTLSAVYSAARDQAKSEEQLRAILADDPNDATANNDLGYLWADQNRNLDDAERLIRKALELDERQRKSGAVMIDSDLENAAYVDSLGWVLFRKGNLAEARKCLEKAATLPGGSDDPVVWDHLGDVRFKQGERDRAAEAWKKALECYEAGHRKQNDGRPKDIQHKLKQLEAP